MRGQRRARDVPVQYSTGTVQCRYSTGTVQHCTGTGKKIPGGAGTHTGHTGTVYRSCTADGVQKWQALSGAQFSSVSVHI